MNDFSTLTGQLPASPLPNGEADEIAIAAYIFVYPLVIMEMTRQVTTNVSEPSGSDAPMNQFAHVPAFPDADFTDVVRPNADTLYSSLQFDVADEPLVISVPDSGGRYYMLPMLDAWSDVFASAGSRTTGTGAQTIVLSGPAWHGAVPAGALHIKAPTARGWIIGRTGTAGVADYPAVHEFQHGMAIAPLSAIGSAYRPPKGSIDPNIGRLPPVEAVERMSAKAYFSLAARLMTLNPPHANDYPILHQMARLGIEPGSNFALSTLPADSQSAIESAPVVAFARIKASVPKAGMLVNGWRINYKGVGTYGTDYLQRAGVAYAGLGANVVEDAIYPTAFTQSDGKEFESDKRYIMHFSAGNLPPARGFWSLTMYDDRQLFTANPINRYAIGDRDSLAPNPDGSLDLYIQRESPGKERESNWLPAPAKGSFTMNLRLYWPSEDALDGAWKPPVVEVADTNP